MDTMTEERSLKCILTEEQVLAYSREMAKTQQDRIETELQKKSVMSDFKDRIERADLILSTLSRKVANGYEHNSIKCAWSFDWEENKKFLYRSDTGELVDSREITEHERQQLFKFEDGEDDGEEETTE